MDPVDDRDLLDRLADDEERNPDTYQCAQCDGPVQFIRNDIYNHIEVEYYRCQDQYGCRDGGERVYDRTGELIRTAGPVFEDLD
ncbi:hypothetical protein HTZ84_21225 [Haloterrigena sp. SYSU A558-1]|uniref:Uncharacterized protein n=1 Tax=Haloterrigena gelatinilytica TaxID=2741724 RepID=A0ABX2LHE2_9EURY|nr:hypothetical protein [Haloterrigena gelatinilytica]NUC74788.1 hypothetical protein [Haloterrigena gelatinilytica]